MSHYAGKYEKDLKTIMKTIKGREGKFYQIFNKYGFFDVSDEKNGLTKEQRAQVPTENQNRFTQFSNAIAEMVQYTLGDSKLGMLTKSVQDVSDNLDIASQMSNAQLDAINNGFKAIPGGQAVSGAMEGTKSLAGAVLGKSYYDINILPQFSFGIDGFSRLGALGSSLKPGVLRPNWDFIYKLETKTDKFVEGEGGTLRIGADINVNEGNEIYLKNIFGVVTSDRKLNISGDLKGGLTQQEFKIIKKASKLTSSAIDDDSEIKNFKLNEDQMRASFNKYIDMKLWGTIKNRQNWAHGHWGALTHNAMPGYVKTAVCSYIWKNGFAIEPGKSEESALISYLIQIGLFYLIGHQHKAIVYGFPSDTSNGFEGDQQIVDDQVEEFTGRTEVEAFPKNGKIAKRYFTWVADILSRLSYESLPNNVAGKMRERRIKEANLIYEGLGLPPIEYGSSLADLPFEHTIAGWASRKNKEFFVGMASDDGFMRFGNEGAPGGELDGELGTQKSTAIINYSNTAKRGDLATDMEKYIKSLMDGADIESATINSTQRTPVNQARIMFNNLNRNNVIRYRAPGAAVTQKYFDEKQKKGYTKTQPVSASDSTAIKKSMAEAIVELGPINVSRHCGDGSDYNVLDIAPSSIKGTGGGFDPQARTRFLYAIEQEVVAGTISKFLHPGNSKDKAYHIEIPLGDFSFSSFNNDVLPTVQFNLSNKNLTRGGEAWIAPLSNDNNRVNQEENSIEV